MLSLRLNESLEHKLFELTKLQKKSKSQIIKESLELYINTFYNQKSSYEIGEKYFGKTSSNNPYLARDRKKLIKEKLLKKQNARNIS